VDIPIQTILCEKRKDSDVGVELLACDIGKVVFCMSAFLGACMVRSIFLDSYNSEHAYIILHKVQQSFHNVRLSTS
jgi:hypothetical protein